MLTGTRLWLCGEQYNQIMVFHRQRIKQSRYFLSFYKQQLLMLLTWLLRDHIQLLLSEKGDQSLIFAMFEPTDEIFRETIQDSEVLAD